MSNLSRQHYAKIIATCVMMIGMLLILSMTYIALGNVEALTGVIFKMYVVGLIAGGVIAGFGALLFHFSKFGELGSS